MSGRSITRGPAPTSSLSERVQRILSSLLLIAGIDAFVIKAFLSRADRIKSQG